MEIQDSFTNYRSLFKPHMLPLVLGLLGLICLGYGLVQFLPQKQEPAIIFESGQEEGSAAKKEASTEKKPEIVVDIAGAVLKPGVYTLEQESRVQDILIAAGGLSANADHAQISKNMNLAAKVTDGSKLYIPYKGEQVPVSGGQNVLGSQTTGGININTATLKELDTLPGVGQVTAEKIIANRSYSKLDELVSKKSVSQSVFDKIKDKVTVN